jgi:hypothetical protein
MRILISFLNNLFKECLFGHKWKYKTEEIPISTIDGAHKTKIKATTRICQKCHLKEVQAMQWRKYDRYSKEERRDMNIDKIIGK